MKNTITITQNNSLITSNQVNSYKYVVHSVQVISAHPFQVADSSYETKSCTQILRQFYLKIFTLTTSIGFEATVDNRPAIKLALKV